MSCLLHACMPPRWMVTSISATCRFTKCHVLSISGGGSPHPLATQGVISSTLKSARAYGYPSTVEIYDSLIVWTLSTTVEGNKTEVRVFSWKTGIVHWVNPSFPSLHFVLVLTKVLTSSVFRVHSAEPLCPVIRSTTCLDTQQQVLTYLCHGHIPT